MRIPRVFVSAHLELGSCIQLPAEAAHYVVRVLRLEAGRPLVVFNGQGGEYAARLVEASKSQALVELEAFSAEDRQSPLHCHLAIGISKGDRFDWVLQKACELGVTAITPLFTERTEVRLAADRLEKKTAHWQQILISSAEQNQRNRLPALRPAQSFEEFFRQPPAVDLALVLHHRAQQRLSDYPAPQRLLLVIGPEGGLSESEITRAQTSQCHPLALGPRVLRTETAPLVALSLVQYCWGDLR
jgi:16S rRNA (uracil1498-N3)-methyltransferase